MMTIEDGFSTYSKTFTTFLLYISYGPASSSTTITSTFVSPANYLTLYTPNNDTIVQNVYSQLSTLQTGSVGLVLHIDSCIAGVQRLLPESFNSQTSNHVPEVSNQSDKVHSRLEEGRP